MTSQLVAVAFDANDPLGLAHFWAAALRWDVGEPTDGAVDLLPTDGTRLRARFRTGAREKSGKNPMHLDLTTSSSPDQSESVARLVGLGARHVDIGQAQGEPHVVLADPEGNEFCVIEPENSFLAGGGRLGSITCDGSREVGCFWSAVLGWPLVWDQDGETAIRAPDGTGPFVTWGPPVPPKGTRSRLHLEIAPATPGDRRTEVDRLISLGATLLDAGADHLHGTVRWTVMADPDGNQFRVLSPRS
jgi:catechol 2,3-dioxygenase-like lactoylglutathione lyase family enzyme